MRPEGNPLDLNNLPEDYSRDAKITPEDPSSSAVCRKKKSGGKEAAKKDEASKVYECRFCSLKFCKSQALGGHMNRHRQERETETLNKARRLVFTSDLAPTTHLGCVSAGQPIHQPPRIFPPAPSPSQSMYASSPRVLSFPSQYPTAAVRDYYVGHARSNGSYRGEANNYTCMGAPVGQGFDGGGGGGSGGGGVRDVSSLQNEVEEGVRWGRR